MTAILRVPGKIRACRCLPIHLAQLIEAALLAQLGSVQDHDSTMLERVDPVAGRDFAFKDTVAGCRRVMRSRSWRLMRVVDGRTRLDVFATLQRHGATEA